MEVLAMIRANVKEIDESWVERSKTSREWNKEEGRKEGRGEDRGKRWGAYPFFYPHIPPFFLTSKNLLVRRNYSPPLNRTTLLHHCFLPTGPLPLQPPLWPHVLIASKENSLVNGVLRALFK